MVRWRFYFQQKRWLRSVWWLGLIWWLAACSGADPAPLPTPTVQLIKPVQIRGAGNTFSLPIYAEWAGLYSAIDPDVSVEYRGTSSVIVARNLMERRLVDFVGSDSPVLEQAESGASPTVEAVPILAGAVVLAYNLENVTGTPRLVLDRETVVNIYNGRITHWNDPKIVRLNPKLSSQLPAEPIAVIFRSDPSSTTEIFTQALSAFDNDWRQYVGAGSQIDWPTIDTNRSYGAEGNGGVAAAIMNTANSIGYIELPYAVGNGLVYARLINRAGQTVDADADSLYAAMLDFADDLDAGISLNLVDGSGENSWPIAGYSYRPSSRDRPRAHAARVQPARASRPSPARASPPGRRPSAPPAGPSPGPPRARS
jgi:phosphate ABC transporter phosphate-binding protein